MEVVCIKDFGTCRVGDVRELPDDTEFSTLYFVRNDFDKDSVPTALVEAKDSGQEPLADHPEGPVVETRGDTPDETEERHLAEAGKQGEKKAPARKSEAKAAADNDEEKSEG